MDGLSRLGRIVFGVGMVLFGLLYLFHARGTGPAPGPPWTAETGLWAWLIGAGFFAAGVCIVAKKWARAATVLLAAVFLLRVLVVFMPRLFANLRDPGPWTSGAEVMALGAAALVLAGELELSNSMSWESLVLVGRFLFAAALVVVGVQHFLYAKFIAMLIPAWIPGHLFWSYFVGVAFLASALSLATKIQGRLAAALLGLMFLLWVVVLHAPRVVAAVHNGNEWTSGMIALAMCGGSFVLAGALRQADR
ncbi:MULTISPECIES: hypothetical protein [Acidobacteriaceae]|uniref:hypothetical protein n=1 Tax=Acidobacteriaceae TaxID=204434 RepID=UPI00131D1998|nr:MULTISPECIES: hypothetical protein [Acidobacteriaceae]MDW5267114.1 hypothetical protein [Edaphobacter sp.]